VAMMVPEKLPYRVSKGEERIFSLLKNLPDDCIVYYEPIVANRYPDFVAILPSLGVLIIEVKGWRSKEIEKCNSDIVLVSGENHTHPNRQARDYKYRLMDICRNSPVCDVLLNRTGKFEGKFQFPFAHMVALSNIDSEQLKNSTAGDLSSFFPENITLTRDHLINLLDKNLDSEYTLNFFERYFDPKWDLENGNLSSNQIDALRSIIHPEVVIAHKQSDTTVSSDLKVLDLNQEREARNIGAGHRLIWGVAGSGKTVLAISRVKLLAQENPEARILMTCYNKTLAAYLEKTFENYPSIEAKNFHLLAKEIWNCPYIKDEATFEQRLLDRAATSPDAPKYDMIIVDEAQDFQPTWFQCLLTLMSDPDDGDFLIVGDGMQSLYKSRKITWKSLGIHARGRTNYLRKNYRNSREIASLASYFAKQKETTGTVEDEAAVEGIPILESSAVRSSGIRPLFIQRDKIGNTIPIVLNIVRDLLKGTLLGNPIDAPLKPEDIAVLYPYFDGLRKIPKCLIDELEKETKVFWATKDYSTKKVADLPGIRVSTIHSSKGFQFKAVILFGADSLPFSDDEEEIEKGEKLFYVALTRAEDFLVIVSSGKKSEFIDRILGLNDKDLISVL